MDKVELHHVKMFEPVEITYLVTIFVEAKVRHCKLFKVMEEGANDADKVNIIVDWLIEFFPKEFQGDWMKPPQNVYGEATFK